MAGRAKPNIDKASIEKMRSLFFISNLRSLSLVLVGPSATIGEKRYNSYDDLRFVCGVQPEFWIRRWISSDAHEILGANCKTLSGFNGLFFYVETEFDTCAFVANDQTYSNHSLGRQVLKDDMRS